MLEYKSPSFYGVTFLLVQILLVGVGELIHGVVRSRVGSSVVTLCIPPSIIVWCWVIIHVWVVVWVGSEIISVQFVIHQMVSTHRPMGIHWWLCPVPWITRLRSRLQVQLWHSCRSVPPPPTPHHHRNKHYYSDAPHHYERDGHSPVETIVATRLCIGAVIVVARIVGCVARGWVRTIPVLVATVLCAVPINAIVVGHLRHETYLC